MPLTVDVQVIWPDARNHWAGRQVAVLYDPGCQVASVGQGPQGWPIGKAVRDKRGRISYRELLQVFMRERAFRPIQPSINDLAGVDRLLHSVPSLDHVLFGRSQGQGEYCLCFGSMSTRGYTISPSTPASSESHSCRLTESVRNHCPILTQGFTFAVEFCTD